MTVPKDPDEKARWYLDQGRVTVRQVEPDGTVEADVQGSEQYPYRVRRVSGAWVCSCQARVASCAHVRAVALVTPLYSAVSLQQANDEDYDPFEGLVDA